MFFPINSHCNIMASFTILLIFHIAKTRDAHSAMALVWLSGLSARITYLAWVQRAAVPSAHPPPPPRAPRDTGGGGAGREKPHSMLGSHCREAEQSSCQLQLHLAAGRAESFSSPAACCGHSTTEHCQPPTWVQYLAFQKSNPSILHLLSLNLVDYLPWQTADY